MLQGYRCRVNFMTDMHLRTPLTGPTLSLRFLPCLIVAGLIYHRVIYITPSSTLGLSLPLPCGVGVDWVGVGAMLAVLAAPGGGGGRYLGYPRSFYRF